MSDDRSVTKVLNRTALTKLLVQKLRHDEAVIGGIGNANFDLFAAGHRPQNFYMLGCMGLACPIALGVALAQPERGVIALEGDGSILMGLGCLATIANVKPRNLAVIIWDNSIYQITGKQRAATAGATDIVAVARGAGIANSAWARDEAHFEKLIDRRFEDVATPLEVDPPRLLAVAEDREGEVDGDIGAGEELRQVATVEDVAALVGRLAPPRPERVEGASGHPPHRPD